MLSLFSIFSKRTIWAERVALILIGMLYPLGFAPIDLWPLTVISLALLSNEILAKASALANFNSSEKPNTSHKATNIKSVSRLTGIGSSFFAILFYWSIGAFTIGVSWVYVSIHNFGHVPVVGAVAISFLLVLTLSVIKAFAGTVLTQLLKWFEPTMMVLLLPLLWVVFEFIQTFIFSGFPWLFAGYSQIDGPFSQLATWLGVYGISWFLIAIIVALVEIIRKVWLTKPNGFSWWHRLLQQKSSLLLLAILISVPTLAELVSFKKFESEKKSIKVALVQPNVAQERKWDRRYFAKIMDILYEQSENHWDADLLVWPEGAIPAYQHQVVDIISDLNQRAKSSDTDLLLGLPIYKTQQEISYSTLISLGQTQQEYQKQVLVPFGEYVPLGQYLRGVIEFLNLPMSSFSPAINQQKPFEFSDYQVIPAICYEITYPGIVHQLAQQADRQSHKAKLLVTVSNDAWFGDSLGPYQHMQMARMRALELGMPLVRSTNDGITAVVDAKGRVIKQIPRYQQQTLSFDLPLDNYRTLYRTLGLNGVYLLLMVNIVLLMLVFFTRSK